MSDVITSIANSINLIAAAASALALWFWRFVMGHNKRLASLESQQAVTNEMLLSINRNIERTCAALEKMETNHRQDIVRAYEKVEAVHLIVIDHLSAKE